MPRWGSEVDPKSLLTGQKIWGWGGILSEKSENNCHSGSLSIDTFGMQACWAPVFPMSVSCLSLFCDN